ncbi:MAG TPA: DUF1127 domain-containing protein [Afifellaceae bacterium]|nr:DUF1127 domain-containing protein [Afifellaceae bacterium]
MRPRESTERSGCLPALERPPSAALKLLDLLLAWLERSRSRERLATLDDRYLKDIGLSRYDVEHETRKWFWQD